MRDIIKLSVVLFIICAIASATLAYTNLLTAPQIESGRLESAKQARVEVMPAATDFTAMDEAQVAAIAEKIGFTSEELNDVYIATSDGTIVGYTIQTTVKGYSGDLIVLSGITLDGTFSGVQVLVQTETAGLGTICQDPEWIEQYAGKNVNSELSVIKIGAAKDSEISAITGATITSRAVTNAVNIARLAFLELQGGN